MRVASVVAGAVLLALGGIFLRLRRRLLIVTVEGSSMAPTYRDGDRLLARRCRPDEVPRPGDAVVVDLPPTALVPGSAPTTGVPATGSGSGAASGLNHALATATTPEVSGRMIKRVAAVSGSRVPGDMSMAERRVPAGKIVLRGDNPTVSIDSRHYGYVSVEHCVGTVLRRMAT